MTSLTQGKITIITGPTASGKSARALALAEESHGVIINADSQQMYRDLRILTARPREAEEALVPHRLYGTLGVQEHCSAGSWLRLATMEIDWARSQGQRPIVIGGTGLYLKALMQGIADMPEIAPEVRAQSVSDYETMGKDAFAARLREVDPAFFERLKVYDRQRLIRAWEVWLGSGRPLSYWQQQGAKPVYPAETFELIKVELEREELYRRCDARVHAMIDEGAVDEVRAIMPLVDGPLVKVIGVRELAAYIDGKETLGNAIEQMQQATRNYAKRQLTWLRTQL